MRRIFWLLVYMAVSLRTGIAGAQNLPGPAECGIDNKCYEQNALMNLQSIYQRIDYLDLIANYSVIIVGICGIAATVMISLQGDSNKYWTRPIGIIATALVTGITALVSSFHIPETKDGLIDIYGKLGKLVNEFEISVEGKTNETTQNARIEYVMKFNDLKLEILKLKGTPKFSTNPLSPLPSNVPPVSPPAGKGTP